MRVVVIGGSGRTGKLIIDEALTRGMEALLVLRIIFFDTRLMQDTKSLPLSETQPQSKNGQGSLLLKVGS